MYLSKVELHGFKSFAEKVALEFNDGITCVVGPNGCGKSNISDAIRWVLGEQSAKSLRGDSMEDVIFNGSESRKQTGMAEVLLTMSDVQGVLPVDYNEVTISRRLFRTGESDYFINKIACRLKDVTELFLDTGMGRKAYSFIEQGRVEWVLNAKPSERRFIFEEAAGIMKFKTRKIDALKKLESAEINLARVNDVIIEVEKQLNSVKRQARKAERYRILSSKLKEVEIYAGYNDFLNAKRKLDGATGERERIKQDLESVQTELSVKEAETEKLGLEMINIDRELMDLQKQSHQIDTESEKLKSDIAVFEERKSGLNAEMEKTIQSIRNLETETAQLREESASKEGQRRKISENIKNQLEEYGNLEGQQRTIEEEIKILSEEKESRNAEIIDSLNKLADVNFNISNLNIAKKNCLSRIEALKNGIERQNARKAEYAEREKALKENLSSKESSTAVIKDEIAKAHEKISETEIHAKELQRKIDDVYQQYQETQSRLKVLREFKRGYEGYSESAKALLKLKDSGDPLGAKALCSLADIVSCEQKYETCLESLLMNHLQDVIVESHADALELVDYLKSQNAGMVRFVPLDMVVEIESPAAKYDYGLERCADFVKMNDAKYLKIPEVFLANTYMVDNIGQGMELKRKYRDRSAVFATIDGSVVGGAGTVSSGVEINPETMFIGRARRIENLEEEFSTTVAELDGLKKQLSSQTQEIVINTKRIETLRDSLHAEELAISELKKDMEMNSAEQRRAEEEINGLIEQIKFLEHDFEEYDKQILSWTERQKESDAEKTLIEDKISAINNGMEKFRRQSNGIENELTRIKITLAEAKVQQSNIEAELEKMRKTIEDMEEQTQTSKDFIDESRNKLKEIADGVESKKDGIRSKAVEKSKIEDGIRETMREKDDKRTLIDERNIEIRKKRQVQEELSSKSHGLDITASECQIVIGNINEKMVRDYRTTVDSIEKEHFIDGKWKKHEEQAVLEVSEEEGELLENVRVGEYRELDLNAETEERIKEISSDLREKIESMGPVNLIAIQEYEGNKARFEFLIKQRDDLDKAKTDLKNVINEINRTTKDMFAETFYAIKKNFSELYTRLFEGGEAQLVLLDEGDILESGVDIVAKPPGKQFQHISLLSGGEKTLLSIALLFAIFLTKPSPFCVLDEIDAALDEANVMRYTRLMHEFAKNTQFIIITHNKLTMEMADVIYGVTMEEPGISKIISAKLQE